MTNKAISRVLKETAALIDLTGGNPFRSRALFNAGRTIERLEQPVTELIASDELTQIRGIGSGLAAQIAEVLEYGSFEARDTLLGSLPPGLLDVLRVKGLGAKKARVLWQQLGIQSLDDLEAAALTGRIADLDGFAEKSQSSILENLTELRSYEGKRRFADAWADANRLLSDLQSHTDAMTVQLVGDVARCMEIVEEIAFVIATPKEGAQRICASMGHEFELSQQESGIRARAMLPDGLKINILFVEPSEYGSAVLMETGPAVFVTSFRSSHRHIEAPSESELFGRSGLEFIAPELRDLPDACARTAELSALALLSTSDLKGILHNHSTYSDGAHTLRQMSEACRSAGFEYFGICDHSRSLKIANGMSIETALKQKAEIEALNLEFEPRPGNPFHVFFGIESDILADGSLDYPDEVLANFDMVVASVHVKFNMSETEATERIIRAVANPYTTILGHPTGRLILKREGYPLNHQAVLEACARYGVAIELNANPYRLDLDWRWIETAVGLGVPVAINPDAHSIDQLDLMKWGALIARKGGLTAKNCLNSLSLKEFSTFLNNKRIASGLA